MAKILFLCPRVPYPLTGGAKIRMYFTAKLLSKQHTVDLLVIDKSPVPSESIQALQSEFNDVHVFDYPAWRFTVKALSGLFSGKPIQSKYFSFADPERWVARNVDDYDLLYCYLVRTAQFVVDLDKPKVLDFADALSETYGQFATGRGPPKSLLYALESRRLARYERAMIERFDQTFITTEEDRDAVAGDSPTPPTVLPNGVKPYLLMTEPGDPTTGMRLAFLGKMDYFPNVDAVVSFCETLLPAIERRYPNVSFSIIGGSPSRRVKQLDEHRSVEVTGFVEKPQENLRQADIFIAPLRYGSGIQNKILEAMTLGLPVITTPLGASGIGATDETHYLISELNEEFADAVCWLLANPSERARLGSNAREFIASERTWDVLADKLLDPINSVLESP